MIVTCERCDSRFQLDDSRVASTGARVRCSKCKHAFLVLPPDSGAEETVHALAADAVRRGAPTPAGVTEDLATATSRSEPEDQEWQFAEQEKPEARRKRREPVADAWQEVLEPEKPPEVLELDSLGSPESWSFVAEDLASARTPRAASPAVGASGAVAIGRIALVRVAREAETSAPEALAPPSPADRRVERIGWIVTIALLVAIASGIDWTGRESPPLVRSVGLPGGLVVEELSARRLENLAAGPVLVVGGFVTNPRNVAIEIHSRLLVRVAGSAVSSEAGAPRDHEALRERPPEETSDSAALLSRPLGPGERRAFEAVLEAPPRGDALLEVELETARAEAPTADPSPPSPPPSSG